MNESPSIQVITFWPLRQIFMMMSHIAWINEPNKRYRKAHLSEDNEEQDEKELRGNTEDFLSHTRSAPDLSKNKSFYRMVGKTRK